jgi:hypothetical protein
MGALATRLAGKPEISGDVYEYSTLNVSYCQMRDIMRDIYACQCYILLRSEHCFIFVAPPYVDA